MKNNELLSDNKDFPVYNFCIKNNIDCSWDLDRTTTWTNIYFKDTQIFQFEHFTTVEQFFAVMKNFYNGTKPDDISDIVGGKDFFWSFENKKLCKKFIEHNASCLLI